MVEITFHWSIRYLGIFIACHVSFRCSTDHAKRSFYRAANAIFAKVGLFASEDVSSNNMGILGRVRCIGTLGLHRVLEYSVT